MACWWRLLALLECIYAIELTFEVDDNANQCFFEDFKAGAESVIEYQVVVGGRYDIDVVLQDPNDSIIYSGTKKQYDSYSWKASVGGAYKVCFSNEFSSFTHKVVYMDWHVTEDSMLDPAKMSPMTQIETLAIGIGRILNSVEELQNHHRLREATGRKRAEDLNERVLLWSLGQAGIIMFIGIAQVCLLRSFFTEKRPPF